MRVLLAEDQIKLASFVRQALTEAGFTVDVVHDGDEALELATTRPYDGLVLDIMMPGRDGLSLLRLLRGRHIATPALFLTARGEVSERIEGLELGADDYVAKPFDMSELVARVKALVRRRGSELASVLRVADLTIDLMRRHVTRGKRPVVLTPREFALLEFLARTPGRVVSRTQIIEKVWEYHFDPDTNVVDVYTGRLRRKLNEGGEANLLHAVRGVGYKLEAFA
ncbi:MAG: response regulator transcription factor [Luteolibacter sp.]|uniref:response regulator transcription factor n=1 Tax=Luteolibacter sp. TaxID=1962973 RepID=UPI00326682B9